MPLPTFMNLPEEKRQKFLDYAIDEFAQYDYNSASISRIVSRAGIAKGSLYQYFIDKRDLYHYLLELATEKKIEFLANSKAPDADMNLFDTLLWLFQEMAKFQLFYPKLTNLGYCAIYGKSPLPEDTVAKATLSSRQYFADLIKRGKERGEVRPEIDPDIAAFVFTAALTELIPFLSTQAGINSIDHVSGEKHSIYMEKVEKIFKQIVTILQSGIAQR